MRILFLVLFTAICFGKSDIPKIEGNKEIPRYDLYNLITLPYSAKEYDHTLDLIKSYYESHGLYKSELSFDQDKKVIHIKENEPCYIDEIKIIDIGREIPKKIKDELIFEGMKHKSDDFCSEAIISKYVTSLQAYLQKEKFYFYQMDRPVKELEPNRTKMDLLIHLYLGPKVSVEYVGAEHFKRTFKALAKFLSTSNDLDNLEKDASLAPNLEQFMVLLRSGLEKMYQQKGYTDAQVEATSTNPLADSVTVTLNVQENFRNYLESLEWHGNHVFSSKELTKIVKEEIKNYGSSNLYGIFDYKIFEGALSRIQAMYSSKGYLFTEISKSYKYEDIEKFSPIFKSFFKLLFNKNAKLVSPTVTIHEGLQTNVQDIIIKPFDDLTSKDLKSFTGININEPFDIISLDDRLRQLEETLRNLGYLEAKASIPDHQLLYSSDYRSVTIPIQVDPGKKYTMGNVYITGNFQTRDSAISKEFLIKKGEVLTPDKINEAKTHLESQSSLKSVEFNTLPGKNGESSMIINVTESTPGQYSFGPFYRTDLGIGFYTNLKYSNLFGRMHTASAETKFYRKIRNENFIEYTASLGYRIPNIFAQFDLQNSLNTERRDLTNFDYKTFGLVVGPRKSSAHFDYGVDYQLSKTQIYNTANPKLADDFRLGSITPQFSAKVIQEKLHFTISQNFEDALETFGSTKNINYFRPITAINLNWRFSDRFSFVTRSQYGFMQPWTDESYFPLIKRFRMGGFESLRGFSQDAIAFDRDDNLNRMSMFFVASDLIYWLNDFLGVSGVFDLGNVYKTTYPQKNYSANPEKGLFREDFGLALNASTPVGIFNLGIATPLNPFPYEDSYRIFFSFFN